MNLKKTVTKKTSTKIEAEELIKSFKKVAILCSGGDSPGMNAAIRGITRTAIGQKMEVMGVLKGYSGLIEGRFQEMCASSVGNILQRGGTILQTSRCPEFMTLKGREKAYQQLKKNKIEALIVIGGDGSFKGANQFYHDFQFPVVGIPGTIDNDISGTDYTIGFDTAVETAVNAVDKIRDTASSHDRTFIVEVMGRNSPALALHVGVCTGAENIIFKQKGTGGIPYETIAKDIKRGIKRGKNSSIIVVAEGETPGLSYQVQKVLQEEYKLPAHVCILGHIQRGGVPSATDRFIASEMGYLAIKALITGNFPAVCVVQRGEVVIAPLENCLEKKREVATPYTELASALSI